MQGFVAGAHQNVGKHELTEQERERQQQCHQQAFAQVGQHHQKRRLPSVGTQQLRGVHQVAQVDRLQVVGDGAVHERQGHGEIAADQNPRGSDHLQGAGAIQLQQAHRRHHGRHGKGQQDQNVHQRVELGKVVMHHKQQRQNQHH